LIWLTRMKRNTPPFVLFNEKKKKKVGSQPRQIKMFAALVVACVKS